MDVSQAIKTRATLSNLLSKNQNFGILIRPNADLDTMAAGLSLYLSLKNSGKNVQIVSETDPIVEIASLVGINKLQKEFSGEVKSISIVLPYKKVGIEKVSYFKEGENLKVNLIGGTNTLNVGEGDIKIQKNGSGPEVVFCIGFASLNDTDKVNGDDTKIVNIDDRPSNTKFGDVVLADPQFSSKSEIVTKLLKDFAFSIDADIAQNLMDGLLYATKNFTSNNTSPSAFEAAAILMKKGAKRRKINEPNKKEQNIEKLVKNDDKEEVILEEEKPREEEGEEQSAEKIPSDWFMPKVYKGSKKHN